MECAAPHCHNAVTSPDVGRPRRYCSDRCRKADSRRRQREAVTKRLPSPITGDPGEAVMVAGEADLDTQVVLAVHEAIALRNTFARLSSDARPELGVHCEQFLVFLDDGLHECFGGVVDG